jgi:hypothetical protein
MYPEIDAPVFVRKPQQPFFGVVEAAKLFTFRRAETLQQSSPIANHTRW